MGAALQFRMLATSGGDTDSTVGGLASFSLLGVGGLLALPVFALPVILVGAPTNRGLVNAAVLGAVGSPTGSPHTGCRCVPDLLLTAYSGSGIEAAGPPAWRVQRQRDLRF